MQGDHASHFVIAYCRSLACIAGNERADRDGRKSHDIGGCGLMGLGEKIASLIISSRLSPPLPLLDSNTGSFITCPDDW